MTLISSMSFRRSDIVLDSISTFDPEVSLVIRSCYGQAISAGFLVITLAATFASILASRV